MTLSKRIFDVVVAGALMVLLVPVMVLLILSVLLWEGRPIFHLSDRMRGPNDRFVMWKIRTMAPSQFGDGVTGGHVAGRITATGRWLRKWRLDELPQLWNVLRGDMSLVGPRPPLPRYVKRYPALYDQVLQARPGITGPGTLRFVQHEARVLARCVTAEQTDAVYAGHCLRRKALVDLVYQRQWSLWLDVQVLWQTARAFCRGFRG